MTTRRAVGAPRVSIRDLRCSRCSRVQFPSTGRMAGHGLPRAAASKLQWLGRPHEPL